MICTDEKMILSSDNYTVVSTLTSGFAKKEKKIDQAFSLLALLNIPENNLIFSQV